MRALVLVFILLLSQNTFGENRGFNVNVGAGTAFGLGTLRVGYESWEFGYLNFKTLGATHRIAREKDYITLGAAALISTDVSPGLHAAYGYSFPLLNTSWFDLRVEGGATVSINGVAI